MFCATERLPLEEMVLRQQRCREHCAELLPEAAGMLVFSRINIYYLTGTLGSGVLWLPREGEAVLLVRKGEERCRLESPLRHVARFSSYTELPTLCAEAGSPLPEGACLGAEMGGLPWSLADMLQCRLKGRTFRSCDKAIVQTRSVKTPWELAKMRTAGERHNEALAKILPEILRPGMTEQEIAHACWKVFFELGHGGPTRMGNFGEECFLGHIAAGESGNYPSHFNGPLGLVGEHPSAPFMGSAHVIWKEHSPLALDIGFMFEGYNTDKTQLYWSGPSASIPDTVRRAQAACLEIQQRAAEGLKSGGIPSRIWSEARERAVALGVEEGFMGLGTNKVNFLGHGIGLVIDEVPVLARGFDAPLQPGTVMAIEPKVGLPGIGMVGTENTFEVTDEGGRCLTGSCFDIICVE